MNRDFWKVQGIVWALGPIISGFLFWYTALGIGAFQTDSFKIVDLIGAFFAALFLAISGLMAPFMGVFGMQTVTAPSLLASGLFWLISRILFEKLRIRSRWALRLCSALAMPVLLCVCFFAFNMTATIASFSDFYFYRPQDKTLEDYSEWGFLSVFGPLYLLYVFGVTGFVLGLICHPRSSVTLPVKTV